MYLLWYMNSIRIRSRRVVASSRGDLLVSFSFFLFTIPLIDTAGHSYVGLPFRPAGESRAGMTRLLRVVPRRVRRATVAAARDRPSHRCRSRWTRWRRPWSPPPSAVHTPPCCPNGVYRRGRRPSSGCRPIRIAARRPTNRSISRLSPEILR